jgi:Protein of unknown function (DUF993)
MPTLQLPTADRRMESYQTQEPRSWEVKSRGNFDRIALAAAHVVADPFAKIDPWIESAIDWEGTIAYRRYLWSCGLGVAEAMDTAQRGMGLDWARALKLIEMSVDASRDVAGAVVFSGAGTDHLALDSSINIDDVIAAYEHQIAAIEKVSGRVIVMASRALASIARSPDDYVKVYGRILRQVREPVIIHWLGDMFEPSLRGYWGSSELPVATEVCLSILSEHPDRVDGIKLSLLDKDHEISMRRRLPRGVRMYTGDDFNYAELIAGDSEGYSDALLGIFDAIAPAASSALDARARGEFGLFHEILAPTVPLARHLFGEPTRFYKTGIVFLAYLNGHQSHFTMVGGQQSARSLIHLAQTFRLADAAGLLRDPDIAAARMRNVLRVHGVEG